MREIKFRAWSIYHDKMFYPEGSEDMTDKTTSASLLAAYNDGGMDTLMQYTGLLDRNGKEIFEGDIVQEKDGSKYIVRIEDVLSVSFEAIGHTNFVSYVSPETPLQQIVGNIYENPELVGGDKKDLKQ